MRFNAAATALAYTNGYGGGTLSIAVVDTATGLPLAVLPGGHDPRWLGPTTLVARSLDGAKSEANAGGYLCHYVGANDGDMDAIAGRAAYTADRSSGVTVYAPALLARTFPGTFEPALSAGGTIALRDLASGAVRLERLDGCSDPAAADPNLGPATRARWSGGTVVWDSLPYGRILGRSTPDQPTIDLSVPGHGCSMPVALWTGAILYVGFVVDDGLLSVAVWDGLVRQDGAAWLVATSGGSAFDWDLAVVAGDAGRLRVAYLSPAGALVLTTLDVAAPPASLLPEAPEPKPPEPIEPPEPPEPETPEPPEPETPEPPDPEAPEMALPTVDMIPRDQTVMAADAIDQYLIGNPRLGLAAGIWPADFYGDGIGNAERLDVVSAYLIGTWCPYVCSLGPFPGDAAGWETRRNLGLDHTFHVIEAERGEKPAPPEAGVAGPVRGPIGTDRRFFTVP